MLVVTACSTARDRGGETGTDVIVGSDADTTASLDTRVELPDVDVPDTGVAETDSVGTPDDTVVTLPDIALDDTQAPDVPELTDVSDLTSGPSDTDAGAPECAVDSDCPNRHYCAAGDCVPECDPLAAGLTGMGCFHLAVDLPNSVSPESGGGTPADELPTGLVIQNPWMDSSVNVEVLTLVGGAALAGGSVAIAAGGSTTVSLPNRNLTGTVKTKAAFAVESDRPVIILMMSPMAKARSTSLVRLLPLTPGARNFGVITGPSRAFVTIAAAEDETAVTVRPTGPTLAGNGLKAMAAGQTYTVTLASSEVLHLEAPAGVDLSGTRIDTSKPVAVFAGSASTAWSERCCNDMVAEAIPPRSALGTDTIVTPGPPRGLARDMLHVVALDPGTDVTVETATPLQVTLDEGGVLTLPLTAATRVTSSRPVLVALRLAEGHARTAQGDVCEGDADCPPAQSCSRPPGATTGLCIAACTPAQDDCPSAAHLCLDRFGAVPTVESPGICFRRPCDPVDGSCGAGAVCDPASRCREPCTVSSVCSDPVEYCGLFGVSLMCGAEACTADGDPCPEGGYCVVAADGTSSCTTGCTPTPKCETAGYHCVSSELYLPGTAPFDGAYCLPPTCSVDATGASADCPAGFDCLAGTCVPFGDPGFVIVPSVERHQTVVPVVVPPAVARQWLAIMAPDGATVLLDGESLDGVPFKPGSGGWVSALVPVEPGFYRVSATAPVGVLVIGMGAETGFAASGVSPLGIAGEPDWVPTEDTGGGDAGGDDTIEPDDTVEPDTTPLDTGEPPPTWTDEVGPLLALRCAPCHTGGSKLGGLSVETWLGTQAPSAACAGFNKGAAIYMKSNGEPACTGAFMPPTEPHLTTDELALIKAWIDAGQPE